MEYYDRRVKELEDEIQSRECQIKAIEKEKDELKEELEKLTSSDCEHKIIKTLASSGIFCIQTISCEKCKIIFAQKSGTSLFHPSEADKIFAGGN